MAKNVELYRNTGSTYESVAIKTDWSLITNKPFSFAPTSHTHSATDITAGTLPVVRGGTGKTTALTYNDVNAAPTSHVSTATTYGVGTTTSYGHCRIINNLTTSSHTNGYALSAYQGKVLKDLVDEKIENQVVSSGSYNNMNEPGLYTARTVSVTGGPGGYYNGVLTLKSDTGSTYFSQIAIAESTGKGAMKYRSNGQVWRTVSTAVFSLSGTTLTITDN